jgi:hypothetical protein
MGVNAIRHSQQGNEVGGEAKIWMPLLPVSQFRISDRRAYDVFFTTAGGIRR